MKRTFERITNNRVFKIFTIVVLLMSILSTSVTNPFIYADTGGEYVENEWHYGKTRNEKGSRDVGQAIINKQVSHGNKPGEHFIDLTITGKDAMKIYSTDIVLVYDNSYSMRGNPATVAYNATKEFIEGLLSNENKNLDKGFRVALVTFGTNLIDGSSEYTLTKNAEAITGKLPSTANTVQYTNTQAALKKAGEILQGSDADNKIIVTITDGVPTVSEGNGTSTDKDTILNKHIPNTVATADGLKGNYELYTIAIGVAAGQDYVDVEDAEEFMHNISSTQNHAYFANQVQDMVEHLEDITIKLNSSIVHGVVEDPMSEYFILQGTDNWEKASNDSLTDGSYYLSASHASLLDGVTVTTEGQKIKINGLNLGENESVTLRYKVQADTEKEGFDPGVLYPTNGPTTLTPRGDKPEDKNEFPVPEAAAKPINVSGEKIWDDAIYDGNRPESITIHLMRPGKNEDDDPIHMATTVVEPNQNGKWYYEFENVTWYDSNGNFIEDYYIVEDPIDHYEVESGQYDKDDFKINIENIFQPVPKISLEKTAESTSQLGKDVLEVGETINYTFTIENTGNIPLESITLTDELQGISAFEYETINGNPITGDITNFVLYPGDVLVATATYEITQADFDYGQVKNKAKVVGTPFGHDPDDPDSPQLVEDVDEAYIPGNLEPNISLTKVASPKTVTEVGEEITYSFTVENIGNTTLYDVKLIDDMLGGEIELVEENKTLFPGDTFTVEKKYNATKEDLNAGEIKNEATVKGTPPPAYTEVPENPNEVTDKDDEVVNASQNPKITLKKVADKDGLVVNDTITYTFTATNTGNVTLTNVKIDDILAGISPVEYVSINDVDVIDPNNIILHAGDVLKAKATYTVKQSDVDFGQLVNDATVTGEDPNGGEVTDDDKVTITQDATPGIELTKTSDKEIVTAAGEKVTFTFTVKNTGNVTLTDVKVTDPMLDDLNIAVNLDKTTLAPGETATATAEYEVTEADIEKGTIKNVANAIGNTPNSNDPNPNNSDEVEIKVAKVKLEKSSQPGIFTEAGQEITYTLKVTNTGEVTLNNIKLIDEKLGGTINLPVNTLEPGQSTEVKVPYTVTETDVTAKEIVNTAQVVGEPEGYDPNDSNSPQPVTDEAEDTVLYAALQLEKTSDKQEITKAGETLTYIFDITNNGSVALEKIEVNDPMLQNLDIAIELDESQLPLQPGDSITATAKYKVTQDDIDNGGVKNIATVTGTPPGFDPEDPNFPDEPPVSPPSEHEVPANQQPSIELKKIADKTIYEEANERVKYTFTVTNTGNVTLTDVKIDDKTFGLSVGLVKPGNDKNLTVTLAPGESATGQYTHVVTQQNMDDGEIYNVAITEGTPPSSYTNNPNNPDKVTDEDDETVKAIQEADLMLVKEADKENIVKAGDVITYTLSVTNTGNVTLDNVKVNDEMLGGTLDVSPSTLQPGETGTAIGTYTVTQEDIDRKLQIENIATATGTSPGKEPDDPDNPTTPPAEVNVPVTKDPAITLVKQADKESLVADETITYTFTATNTGNQTLTNVSITDPLEGLSTIQYESVNNQPITDVNNITLKPGDVLVAKATYTVTQDDVDFGRLTNEATVEGTPPPVPNPNDPDNPIEQNPITDKDDEMVPAEHKPALELEKTSDKEEVTHANQVITYKFTVTNTGNVTLDNVKVNDPMLEALATKIELGKTKLVPGESTIGYAEYIVTQHDMDNEISIDNIATATGTPPGTDPDDPNNPESPPAEKEVPIVKNPDIGIVKAADKVTVSKAGEEIEYTFTVTNTGNVTLTDVVVKDDKLGVDIELGTTTLKPGESTTGTGTYIVTQEEIDKGLVENIATTTGFPPGYDPANPPTDPYDPTYPPTDEGEEIVPAEQHPDISLEKSVDHENVYHIGGGDKLQYTFVITNIGNVTLTNVELNDPMLGGKITLEETTLAPGESTTITLPYTTDLEDYNKGYVENEATTTGFPPGYDLENPPTDPSDPTYPPEDDDKVIVKTKHPEIQLIKTSDTLLITEPGQVVTYTFKVKNAGNVTLHDVTVKDDMFGRNIILPKTSLEPGETVEAYAQYTVTEADLLETELYNVAKATGIPEGHNPEDPQSPQPPEDEDEETIPTKKGSEQPAIHLEKTNDKKQVTKAGETVTYSFKVTNTGGVTLTDVEVNDPMLGGNIKLDKTTLAPGESTTGTAKYTITDEDLLEDELVNTATATGTPENFDPEDPNSPKKPVDEDKDVVYTTEKLPEFNPAIKLLKTSDTTVVTEEGQNVTYFFKVTNTGDVTLEDVSLYDPMLGGKIELDKSKLIPGEFATGSGTYTVEKSDLNRPELPNEAKTFGYATTFVGERINLDSIKEPSQLAEQILAIKETYPNEISEDVDDDIITTIGTGIQLIKTTDTEVITEAGQVVTYIFKVKNTGEGILEDVTVDDPMLNERGIEITLDKTTLAPGETAYGTAKYVVTLEDLEKDELVNIASVTGTPEGYDPEDPNSPDIPVDEDEVRTPTEKGKSQPAIQLEKTSNKDIIIAEGEEITYTFVITNIGGVTLKDVELNDPMLGGNIALEETTLAPGESTIATATYIVKPEDLAKYSLNNIATVTGTPEGYDPEDPNSPDKPMDTDEDIVYTNMVPPANPSIHLLKTSNVLSVSKAGEIVTYTFKVTNTGNVTLTDINITDPMIEGDIVLGKTKLAPGEITYATAEYVVTQQDIDNGNIYNEATVEGTPPGYNPDDPNSPQKPVDDDNNDIPVEQKPAISLVKTSETDSVEQAGDTITYKFEVTNTGNVTLENVKVDDEMLEEAGVEIELVKTVLAPGETTTGTAIYTVTQADIDSGLIENIATATGTPPGYDPENPPTDPNNPTYPPVSPPSEEDVPTIRKPSISIVKTTDTVEVVKAGDTITYKFEVTNTGNVTLENVQVNDEMLEEANVKVKLENTTLAPGETTTGTAIYRVTQADIDSGLIKNIATATGTPPGYDPENPPTNPDEPTYPPVSPPSEVDVPTKHEPSIELEKTSNLLRITKAGDKVTYKFKVTNTGNVTLTDVEINDPMLGGVITVDDAKLKPGKSTTILVDYVVTTEDMQKEELENIATAIGTPPGYDPTNPVASEKPEAEDKDIIPVDKTDIGKVLPKTATQMYSFIALGVALLVLGITIHFTRRRKEAY